MYVGNGYVEADPNPDYKSTLEGKGLLYFRH